MYVILQLQHSVGDVSNSTSSTVQSLTELVVFFFKRNMLHFLCGGRTAVGGGKGKNVPAFAHERQNKATPEYSHKHCKENIWIEVCEAVVPNWSPMDITARMTTGKSARKPFLFSLQFVCRNSRIFFSNLFVNFDSIT